MKDHPICHILLCDFIQGLLERHSFKLPLPSLFCFFLPVDVQSQLSQVNLRIFTFSKTRKYRQGSMQRSTHFRNILFSFFYRVSFFSFRIAPRHRGTFYAEKMIDHRPLLRIRECKNCHEKQNKRGKGRRCLSGYSSMYQDIERHKSGTKLFNAASGVRERKFIPRGFP